MREAAHCPMGRGKSWDAHENAALAAAWVAAWREAGANAETGSRAFARAVHERFSKATPPSGAPPPPGRYAARSEQACKQHFADLAAEVRRAGSVPPPPNSPIAQAWSLLRAVPRFRTDVPKIETDEEGADEIADTEDTPVPAIPAPVAAAAVAATPTPRKPRKRARTQDDSATATAAMSEQISGLDGALRSLADALRGLVDTHGERNALMAFSERACTDQQAAKDRAEYLAILRRIYLHKARAKEEEICPRTPAPVVRTPSAATPVARRASTSAIVGTTAAPVIASNGSSSEGGGGGGVVAADFPAAASSM